VLQWLVEAADQLQAFSRHFLCDLHVRQVQWDELYAVLSAVKAGKRSEAQAITRLSRSPDWVWTAMDPESTLLLSIDVGERTLAMAQDVVHQVTQVLAPDCAPLFLTDGFREYMTALLSHYGHWVQQPRRQGPGPMPKPRWMPLPQLLYAQVVKTLRRRRIIAVTHRVVAYLSPADNVHSSLLGRLKGAQQSVIKPRQQVFSSSFIPPCRLGDRPLLFHCTLFFLENALLRLSLRPRRHPVE
jgi:hypothetical protein